MTTAQKIAEFLKRQLDGVDESTIRTGCLRFFQTLRLVDADGNWLLPDLALWEVHLLPAIGRKDLDAFVDEVATCADANPFLVDFLASAEAMGFPKFVSAVLVNKEMVIPEVVISALALDRFVQALLNDWTLLKKCESIWTQARKTRARLAWHLDQWAAFFFFKLTSVEIGINRILRYATDDKMPWKFGRFVIPLNILEAISSDIAHGFPKNAAAGSVLARHRPGSRNRNQKTNAGPTVISSDRKLVLLSPPFPKSWADLYTTWNLAFISQALDTPFWFSKLLIPSVNGYASNPPGYIHCRAMALYAQLHYASFRNLDGDTTGRPHIDWRDRDLTKLWGEINYLSAQKYHEAVEAEIPPDQLPSTQ